MVGVGAGIAIGQNIGETLSQTKKDSQTPPPLPEINTRRYYIALSDEREGPYDFRTIQLLIREKKIEKDTLIWTEGLEDWVEADTILEKYFNITPPPLPK